MIRNKKLAPDAVLDEDGRQRFHGAFTGGFSAGHYNTVGSEEGFKPSTFVSSRANRASHKEQSANDFVDSEDGLLGGILSAKNEQVTFATDNPQSLAKIPQSKSDYSGIGYDPAVENPEINAYRGSKARATGTGQGVYRMDAIKAANSNELNYERGRSTSDSVKVRGVAGFSMNDDDDDVYDCSNITHTSRSTINLEEVDSDGDDDDAPDKFHNGGGSRKRAKMTKVAIGASIDNWLESTVGSSKVQQRCPTDGKAVLDGFILPSLVVQMQKVSFTSPQAPRGFKPGHVFPEDVPAIGSNTVADKRRKGEGGAAASAVLLGEVASVAGSTQGLSVFDIIGEESRRKIQSAIDSRKTNTAVTIVAPPLLPSEKEKSTSSRPMLTSDALLKSTFAGLSQAFQNRFVSSSTAVPTDNAVLKAGLATAEEHASAVTLSASTATSTSTSTSGKLAQESSAPTPSSNLRGLIPAAGSTASFLGPSQVVQLSKLQALSSYGSVGLTVSGNATGNASSSSVESSAVIAALTGPSTTSSTTSSSSASLRGTASRVTSAWYPAPHLSRRFNIKVDGLTAGMKSGRQQQAAAANGRVVDSQLDSMFAGLRESVPSTTSSTASASTILPTSFSSKQSDQDTYPSVESMDVIAEEVVAKPPMSLFKSIFEDSDSDSDDSDEDSEGEEEDNSDQNVPKNVLKNASSEKIHASTGAPTAEKGKEKEKVPDSKARSFLRNQFGTGSLQSLIFPDVRIPSEVPIPTPASISSSSSSISKGVTTLSSKEKKPKEEVNDEAEEEVRVVFRKPVAKARVNTFSSKPKPKRNFTRFDEEEEEDGGADALSSALAESLKRKKGSGAVEVSEEIKEVLEEEVRIEDEREAANAKAAGAFFFNMAESSFIPTDTSSSAAGVAADVGTFECSVESKRIDFTEVNTDEARIVSNWYAKTEEKRKEIVARKIEEDMECRVEGPPRAAIEGVGDNDRKRDRKEKHKKEKDKDKKKEKRKHSSHHRGGAEDSDDEKKVPKSKKSKKSKSEGKKSSHTYSQKKGTGGSSSGDSGGDSGGDSD